MQCLKWKFILVTCTIIGAFGGYPKPPKLFMLLTKHVLVQWGLVFALAYQGTAGQFQIAMLATLASFLMYKVLHYIEDTNKDLKFITRFIN